MRVAGNVIFSTPKREVKNEQTSGGKGGPKITTTTYTYNVDMAIALCEGPIDGIRKMWLNGKLVYDASTGASITSSVASSIHAEGWKVYLGDEAQLPDPTIETTVGVGNVPGYRGMAYIVFDHLDCPNGQVPQLSFEIVASGTSGPSSITFEEVPAPDAPLFALASIVGNRVWQFVGDNGAQPVYSAGPGFFSSEGVRLFSTSDGGDAAPISVQGGSYAMFRSFAPGPSYETVLSIIVVDLDTGETSTPLQYIPGTSSNSLSPAFAAYDPISGDFCAITSAETDIRGMSITIFSTQALTDILMTPSTPMAFYNSVVYTCGTSAGETFLNSYDTSGALIDSVGAGRGLRVRRQPPRARQQHGRLRGARRQQPLYGRSQGLEDHGRRVGAPLRDGALRQHRRQRVDVLDERLLRHLRAVGRQRRERHLHDRALRLLRQRRRSGGRHHRGGVRARGARCLADRHERLHGHRARVCNQPGRARAQHDRSARADVLRRRDRDGRLAEVSTPRRKDRHRDDPVRRPRHERWRSGHRPVPDGAHAGSRVAAKRRADLLQLGVRLSAGDRDGAPAGHELGKRPRRSTADRNLARPDGHGCGDAALRRVGAAHDARGRHCPARTPISTSATTSASNTRAAPTRTSA
jgi:hypothetical protein